MPMEFGDGVASVDVKSWNAIDKYMCMWHAQVGARKDNHVMHEG